MDQEILQRLDQIVGSLLGTKKILNVDEAALFTGLSASYLYRLTSEGVIPHYKPAKKILYFKTEDLERFMLSNRVKGSDERDQEAALYCATNKK